MYPRTCFNCDIFYLTMFQAICTCIRKGGGVVQWLGRRISDQGVPGSNPGRCTFRCGIEHVTFTWLSSG